MHHTPLALVGLVVMVVREGKAAWVVLASVAMVVMAAMVVLEMVLEMVQFHTSKYQWCRLGCTCRLGGDG